MQRTATPYGLKGLAGSNPVLVSKGIFLMNKTTSEFIVSSLIFLGVLVVSMFMNAISDPYVIGILFLVGLMAADSGWNFIKGKRCSCSKISRI